MIVTKEEKLRAIEKAIDMGAEITVSFHECRDRKAAEDTIKVMSSLLNEHYYEDEHGDGERHVNWFTLGTEDDEEETDDGLEVVAYFDREPGQ